MKRTPKTERQGTLAESIGVFALVLAVLMYGILGLKLSAHLPLVPWGASGAFVANCFGVAASQIAPLVFCGLADAADRTAPGTDRNRLSGAGKGRIVEYL